MSTSPIGEPAPDYTQKERKAEKDSKLQSKEQQVLQLYNAMQTPLEKIGTTPGYADSKQFIDELNDFSYKIGKLKSAFTSDRKAENYLSGTLSNLEKARDSAKAGISPKGSFSNAEDQLHDLWNYLLELDPDLEDKSQKPGAKKEADSYKAIYNILVSIDVYIAKHPELKNYQELADQIFKVTKDFTKVLGKSSFISKHKESDGGKKIADHLKKAESTARNGSDPSEDLAAAQGLIQSFINSI